MKITTYHDDGSSVTADVAPEIYNLIQCRSALKLQIRTGLKHSRGSVLAHCQRQGWTQKRTMKGAFADLNRLAVEAGFQSISLELK